MERYQTFGRRIVASIVDSFVFAPLVIFFVWIELADFPDLLRFVVYPIGALIGLAYNILMHWKYGQTLGKMWVKVKVLDVSEKAVSFWQSCLRDIVYIIVDFVQYGVLFALFFVGYSWRSEAVESTNTYMLFPLYVWLVIDTIVCIKNTKNCALHDMIAGTVVVRLDIPGNNDLEKTWRLEPPGPDAYDFSSNELEGYR
jgi:uncharacterized RDD family membrane protein YckC